MNLTDSDIRERMIGCWLGKAVGGTLGQPYEGRVQTKNAGPLALTYYDPVPESMMPNDDLDLQVVHAVKLKQLADRGELRIDCRAMAEIWRHIGMSPGEYGACKRNLALGLAPPTTGAYDNPMQIGMGAAIRSELWACLAPCEPDRAARMAEHDACMDHAGAGVDAARFLAALEAMAFVEHDLNALLDGALTCLDPKTELCVAMQRTREWFAEGHDWRTIRSLIFDYHGKDDFTDVRTNLPFIVLGLLEGCRDGRINFGRAICTAVNCGMDTDCTGATVGAILGIIDPHCIEDRWLKPIGRNLVLMDAVLNIHPPSTIDDFTDLVVDLRDAIGPDMPPPPPPREPTEHLAIPAQTAIVDAMPPCNEPLAWPRDGHRTTLPGQWAAWPAGDVVAKTLLIRYRITIPDDVTGPVRLAFASPQARRAWWDGECVVDVPAGPYIPVLHYGPREQLTDIPAAPGRHELILALAAPPDAEGDRLEWCIMLGQPNPHHGSPNHLPFAFERLGDDQ